MTNEFEYILLEPLKEVGINGNLQTVEKLVLRAPSKKMSRYTAKLKQGIKQAETQFQQKLLSAIKDINEFIEKTKDLQPEKEESLEKQAKSLLDQIKSSDIDFFEFEESFKALCLAGGCVIDESHPMTSFLYEKLSDRDGDNMMGQYLAAFFLS